MKRKYFLLIVLVIVSLVGIFLWRGNTNVNQTNKTTKQTTPLPKEITITLDKNGFSPEEVTIKKGTAVRWKNAIGNQQTVNSDDYPTNKLHKELNFGIFNNNSSVVYVFEKPGTYGYHNHLHPEQRGKVIVEK